MKNQTLVNAALSMLVLMAAVASNASCKNSSQTSILANATASAAGSAPTINTDQAVKR